jgi:hypothetical protein
VGDTLVEELHELCVGVLCGSCLLRCQCQDDGDDCGVYGKSVAEEGPAYLLDPRPPTGDSAANVSNSGVSWTLDP